MKPIVFIFTLFLFIASLHGQETITVSGTLHVSHSDSIQWMQRDRHYIEEFRKENAILEDLSCDVLLVGSSSFRGWTSIQEDMVPLKIINRAYGGSSIRDILYYYDIVVKPFSPKKIILYVENDLAGWGSDLSIGDTYDFFRLFAQKVHENFPGVHLYIVSIKPSPSREKQFSKVATFNSLIKEYCEANDKTIFIDVASHMFNEDGLLKTDIFADDNLHLNEKGYRLWTSVIKPYLMQ